MVIRRHFNFLYNNLLEDNLKKIILPYSEVQIDYVADQIALPVERVLMKLSEMILDEKIKGTLDQGRNCLIVFEDEEPTENSTWSILRDDYMLGAKLKDWDKESDGEN